MFVLSFFTNQLLHRLENNLYKFRMKFIFFKKNFRELHKNTYKMVLRFFLNNSRLTSQSSIIKYPKFYFKQKINLFLKLINLIKRYISDKLDFLSFYWTNYFNIILIECFLIVLLFNSNSFFLFWNISQDLWRYLFNKKKSKNKF